MTEKAIIYDTWQGFDTTIRFIRISIRIDLIP